MLLATETVGIGAFFHAAGEFLYRLAKSLGGPGLFLVALADSSFLSVPEGNDLLIVVLSTGQSWELMSYYVLMTVMGSIAGCSILYFVGRRGGSFMEKRTNRRKMERIRQAYRRWGVWAVLVPSILPPPTPFKVFVLSAGLFKIPFPKFLFAVSVGRSIRYFMWGILAVLYGTWAKRFIQESLTSVGIILAAVLFVGVILWLVWNRRSSAAVETQ